MVAVGGSRATTREFTVKNSEDGKSIIQVFLPALDKATGRMVIACPGGGYGWLSVKNEGTDWADFFLQQGVAYAVLHYRFPNGDRTLPMTDAMQAIRTVRDSAEAWHVNPHDVGIMGFSAGGHLASAVATHAPVDARPDFQILFYPVISMMEGLGHYGSWKNFLGEIFVVTNPDYQGEERQPYNAVVRAMADIFSNVYVIDIDKFGPSYAKGTDFRERYFRGGHLNAMGYQQTAWMLMAYIDRIIRQHPEAFSQVAFIGTDYKY